MIYSWSYSLYVAMMYFGYPLEAEQSMMFSAIITTFVALGMISVGMYNQQYFFKLEEAIGRAVVVMPISLAFILLLFMARDYFVFDGPERTWKYIWCVASFGVFVPALIGIRKGFLYILDHSDWLKFRIAVVGCGRRAAQVEQLSSERSHRSFVILGYLRLMSNSGTTGVSDNALSDNERRSETRRPDFNVDSKKLVDFCYEKRVDTLIIATTERRGMPVHDLLECKLNGIRVIDFSSFWERESGQIALDELSPSWLLFSDGFEMGRMRSLLKRIFDLFVATTILILTAPITIITAILIKLESEGPIFYFQERVGQRGKPFMIVKFRSMRTDAEASGPRWAAKNDNRVTRVGAFIRKVRIDEIPQVFNVFKGDMSLVGPRPERPVFVDVLSEKIPYYNARHAAKPGITGWAQVNYPYGATEEDARMKLAYDLYYIKNGSGFLDIIILMQTAKVLLWNDGAR